MTNQHAWVPSESELQLSSGSFASSLKSHKPSERTELNSFTGFLLVLFGLSQQWAMHFIAVWNCRRPLVSSGSSSYEDKANG